MASKLDKIHKKVKAEVRSAENSRASQDMMELYLNTNMPENINIDLIDPNPNNLRVVDTESDRFKELVDSIRDLGLQQNLVVYKKEKRFVLLTGHRRLAAIKKIISDNPKDNRFSSIPCLVVDLKGDAALGISRELEEKMLLATTNKEFEPINRRGTLENLKIALAYMQLKHPEKKSKGIIAKEVSESVGLSTRKMDYFLRFEGKLIPEFQNSFFDTEMLTFRMAEYLCKLSEKNQRKIYTQFSGREDQLSIESCELLLNAESKPSTRQNHTSVKTKAKFKKPQNQTEKQHAYQELPDSFCLERLLEENGERKFIKPDDLSEEALKVDPMRDLKVITPINLMRHKKQLDKTTYRKYAAAMNQINKQLCVISDLFQTLETDN